MATIHLYLVRHGQTKLNTAGRLQGIYDSELTHTGVRSAQRLARMLADVHFDAAYVSDLGRAQQTSRIITALHPEIKKPTIDVGLREFNFGGLEGTRNMWIVKQVQKQLGIGTFVKLMLSRERFATPSTRLVAPRLWSVSRIESVARYDESVCMNLRIVSMTRIFLSFLTGWFSVHSYTKSAPVSFPPDS